VSTHERFFHPLQYGEGNHVMFSPDGQWLVTINSYGLLVLDISPTSWQKNACRIANRNFTAEEWKDFLGNEPYQKVCRNLPTSESEIKAKLVQARSAAASGDRNTASSAYMQATQWAGETSDAIINGYICWYGSLE